MKTLQEEQIGFLFMVGSSVPGEETSEELAARGDAYARLEAAVRSLPCWTRQVVDHDVQYGFSPYELCENTYEFEELKVQGETLWACGPWFHSASAIPTADQLSLRDAAVKAFEEAAAAANLPVRYVGARYYRVWRETESGVLEGV